MRVRSSPGTPNSFTSRAEWDQPERDIFALIDQDEDGIIILADLPVL